MSRHVVTAPVPPFFALGGRLWVQGVPAGTDNLSWLVRCVETGATAVIDGPSAAEVDAALDAAGLAPSALWTTHTHGDHVGLHHEWQRGGRLPAEVIGSADADGAVPGLTSAVRDGDHVRLGALTAEVWSIEGHQRGHLAYVFRGEDGVIFPGDTLFTGGCGRMFSGPPEAFFASLMRIAGLPGGTRVCCAHEYTEDNLRFAAWLEDDNASLRARGASVHERRLRGEVCVPSTLDEERATNPFLRPGAPSILRALRAQGFAVAPRDVVAAFTATRACKDGDAWRSFTAPWVDPAGSRSS